MIGTFLNVAGIVVGSGLGLFLGPRLPDRIRQTVVSGFGLFTTALGIQMFLKTENSLLVLACLLFGSILGEWWHIEDGVRRAGEWLETRFVPSETTDNAESRFVRGFMTASLLFCIGPVAILGSIQDGLTGDFSLLAVKSVLDCFLSIAFASSLGIGVMFSALPILVYQGTLSLLAGQVQAVMNPMMMNELTAVGGVLLMGVGVSGMLGLVRIRVGNFLPAIALAPVFVAIAQAFGWV